MHFSMSGHIKNPHNLELTCKIPPPRSCALLSLTIRQHKYYHATGPTRALVGHFLFMISQDLRINIKHLHTGAVDAMLGTPLNIPKW